MCECYAIGGRFIGADPSCEVHRDGGYIDQIEDLQAQLAVSEARCKAFQNALLPSEDTEVDYTGLFSLNVPAVTDVGEEYMQEIDIPWETIKKIMKTISENADRICREIKK